MIINIDTKGPVDFFTWKEVANNLSKRDIKLEIKDWVKFFRHATMMNFLRIWAVTTYPKVFLKGLIVSSWYRDPEFNKQEGGSPDSCHLDATATDINNIPESLYGAFTTAWQAICTVFGVIGGVNYYTWGMHFCSTEDKFGHKTFQIRDKRKEK